MIERLFETHLAVRDLAASMRFYEEVVGLELGLLDETRQVAFYWVGGRNVSMLGLWQRPATEVVPQHLAFQISIESFPAAIEKCQRYNIATYNFLRDGATQPLVFGWMPALSIYFRDLDNHELEYIAPLPDEPRPAVGIVSLERWREVLAVG